MVSLSVGQMEQKMESKNCICEAFKMILYLAQSRLVRVFKSDSKSYTGPRSKQDTSSVDSKGHKGSSWLQFCHCFVVASVPRTFNKSQIPCFFTKLHYPSDDLSLAFCARAKGRAHSMLRKCFIWIIWQGIVFVHYEWASFNNSVLKSIGKWSLGRLHQDVSCSFSLAGYFDVWGSFMNLAQQKLDRNFEWCCMFKNLQI